MSRPRPPGTTPHGCLGCDRCNQCHICYGPCEDSMSRHRKRHRNAMTPQLAPYLLPPAEAVPEIPLGWIDFPFPAEVDMNTIKQVFQIVGRLFVKKGGEKGHVQLSMPEGQDLRAAIPIFEHWFLHVCDHYPGGVLPALEHLIPALEACLFRVCERYPGGFDTLLATIFDGVQKRMRDRLATAYPREGRAQESGFKLNTPETSGTHISLDMGDATP